MRQSWIAPLMIGLLAGLAAGEGDELIWRDGQWVRQPAPAKGSPVGELALIRRDVDAKKYAAAVKHARGFLKRYPNEPLRGEVLWLAGEAEMGRGRYWDAYGWYEKLLVEPEFRAGSLFDRALDREMEIARAYLAGKKRRVAAVFVISGEQDGIEMLERIANEHAPGTPRAEQALLTLAEHYFGKSEWADAVAGYEGFLKSYGKSPWAPQAELRLAEALRLSYRGPSWDEAPLIEAEQRYKAFAASYPAAARRAGVAEILEEIRSERARKQYEIGQFYARTRAPGAAAIYFRLVADEYGQTRWAPRAQKALSRLEPPQAPPPAGAAQPSPPPTSRPQEVTQ